MINKLKRHYFHSDIYRYINHIQISVIVGVVAGMGAVLFHYLLERMRNFFEPHRFKALLGVPDYYVIMIPVIGGLICATMTWFFPLIAREKGVMSVIRAVLLKNGFIPIKETIFHLFAPIIAIGTGAPLGPEGPAAKIGGGIGSYLSQLMKLNKNDMVMYTAAGGGAAIAAAFNAPIAGVFFGIEVILLNDLKNRALSALIISSVVADIISRSLLGDVSVFRIPVYTTGDYFSYFFYVVLGVLCGLVSLFYFYMSDKIEYIFDEKFKLTNPYIRLIPVTFIFGLILLKYYTLFGIGYNTIDSLIHGSFTRTDIFVLLFLKVALLALFVQAGAYGGTFAPSLVIGALLGYVFSDTVNLFFHTGLDPVAFALAGMGGVLAGINSIPLTAILLVFEVTNDYRFILPLMLVSIISHLVLLYRKKMSIYTQELMDDNIDVSKRAEVDILSRIEAGEILKTDMDVVSYRTPFRELLEVILNAKYGDLFVVDDMNRFIGIITFKDIRQALMDNDLTDLLIANDLIMDIPVITPHEPLSSAIEKVRQYDIENIPVVIPENNNQLEGIITRKDMIDAYNRIMKNIGESEYLTGSSSNKGGGLI
ncbi:MAG TPA: chloride channel protein [Spirochaetota bacterium]|nr:chloride channel protein [Spirochaetota bacterium]